MRNEILIHIASKDRAGEVGLLLTSLLSQTYKNFDVLILDDGSKVPLMSFYFVTYLINRLKVDGHNVKIIRNDIASGVSAARQQMVEWTMKNTNCKYICRIDDDSIADKDLLLKMKEGIDNGYDLMGCIVPFIATDLQKRDIKEVEPIIGECWIDDKGELFLNMDDCYLGYSEEKILPTHHFRSSCLYKRELHEKGVDYNSRLSKNGFREEQIFSFKAISKGFKLGIHTGAICWHLQTPSGGERNTMNMGTFNQGVFEETTKRLFEDYGDFLQDYNSKIGLKRRTFEDIQTKINKFNNLVYNKKEDKLYGKKENED